MVSSVCSLHGREIDGCKKIGGIDVLCKHQKRFGKTAHQNARAKLKNEAVKELNSMNTRRDGAEAVHSTIDWLEKKDVLRVILRSHLHHKQYVDQVSVAPHFPSIKKR